MNKIQPIEREAEFNIDELFFSRTDPRGVITAGNSVFYRVSGYAAEDLINKPHNTVRHPDMPKAIFQYFWETLKSGQPMVAYVKNMAVDGAFYWVLAIAFPIEGGFISIRMKPTSKVFATIKSLYADLLASEKRDGVKASYALISEKLKTLGFNNYAAFARHALAEEIASRDRHRLRSNASGMAHVFEEAVGKYASIFETAAKLSEVNSVIQVNVNEILSSYRDVRFAAVNMTAEAERGNEKGRVLGTIATTFESWASNVHDAMQLVRGSAVQMNERFDAMTLAVMMARFQCDMLLFLAGDVDADSPAGRREVEPFFRMADDVFAKVLTDITQVLDLIRSLDNQFETLRETINALAVIQQASRIETARLVDGDGFGKHIDGMRIFIASVGGVASKLQVNVAELWQGVGSIQTTIGYIRKAIHSCEPRDEVVYAR